MLRPNTLTPRDFGARGDVVKLMDGTMASGSATLVSKSAHFDPNDVGKAVVVNGAGAVNSTRGCGDTQHFYARPCALVTTIEKANSSTSVTLAAKAITEVSAALVYFGTDDSPSIKRCIQKGTLTGGRCTINDGMTFMVSNLSSTINFFALSQAPVGGGLLDGTGTLIYAPQGTLTPGTNDRMLYIQSNSLGPFPIAGPTDGTHPINIGDTSFTVQNATDASYIRGGDWVVILERDSGPGASDNVYVDWEQVASVVGTIINVRTPFRMRFPNLRAWVPGPSWGLSFTIVGPSSAIGRSGLMENIVLRDFTILVPQIFTRDENGNPSRAVGIVTHLTRHVVIQNLTCYDASQDCHSAYVDQDMVASGNHFHSAFATEYSSQVDARIVGNTFDHLTGVLSNHSPARESGLLLDFGSGFNNLTRNTVGAAVNTGIDTFAGLHDSTIRGNSVGWVKGNPGGSCIDLMGAYSNIVSENTCAGVDPSGPTYGIRVADAIDMKVKILSDRNVVRNNRIRAFGRGGRLACSGVLNSDNCQSDSTQ